MNGLFHGYKVALIDSSFYFEPFSLELREALKQISVYVGETFRDEAEQIKRVLSEKRKPVYEENLNYLIQNVQLNSLNMGTGHELTQHLHNDTWGMLNLLVDMNAKFVLVTADRILIQRVILGGLKVDIFDLSTNCFCFHSEFAALADSFSLDPAREQTGADHEHAQKGTVLFRRGKVPVTLGDEIQSGMEATLHLVNGPDNLVAKVFKRDKLPGHKLRSLMKLQGINDVMEISWAMFPLDMLYYDEAMTIPAGFTERFIETAGSLGDEPLYLGDLPDEYLGAHISDTLRLVLQVVRQVRYLNQYGFFISDYNPGNFSFRKDNSALMQMWDTDSFGYDGYFSGYSSGDRTSQDYDITQKIGAIEFCNDALYVFAFTMLSLGDTPISETKGTFKYDSAKYRNLFRRELFPGNLWGLFEEVFHGNKAPSVEILLMELARALREIEKSGVQERSYRQILDQIFGAPEEVPDVPPGTSTADLPVSAPAPTPTPPAPIPEEGATPWGTGIDIDSAFSWGSEKQPKKNKFFGIGWKSRRR